MPYKKKPQCRDAEDRLSERESLRFAERFVDRLLDSKEPVRRKILLEGLKRPAAARLALKELGFPDTAYATLWAKQLELALQRRNRKRLVELVVQEFVRSPIPRGCEEALLALSDPANLRRAAIEAAKQHGGTPGKKGLKQYEYRHLVEIADESYPVVLKLLQELKSGTGKTVQELLEFWQSDYPGACEFLLRNVGALEELLAARELPRPAKKLQTRVRVISEALAGAEYELAWSTSIERVRQGRRALRTRPLP